MSPVDPKSDNDEKEDRGAVVIIKASVYFVLPMFQALSGDSPRLLSFDHTPSSLLSLVESHSLYGKENQIRA